MANPFTRVLATIEQLAAYRTTVPLDRAKFTIKLLCTLATAAGDGDARFAWAARNIPIVTF